MSAHTIRQAKALAAYRAEFNKQAEKRRKARIEAMRRKILRQMFTDKSSWLFASATLGAAFAIIFLR